MQDNVSPEERLLRLIRGTQKKSPEKETESVFLESKKNRKPSPLPVLNLAKVKKIFSFTIVNRAFLVILTILTTYLVIDLLIVDAEKIEEKVLALELQRSGLEILEAVDTENTLEPLESASDYSEPIRTKNLFSAQAAVGKQTPSVTFMEMVSKLRLQGIVTGPNPQAIIEDTKTRQVYFVSPGGRIGEIELKEILSGRVKLIYHGQEVELSL